ncbi:tumor protein p63-regulated gene 1-like protein [Mustelus asterias]
MADFRDPGRFQAVDLSSIAGNEGGNAGRTGLAEEGKAARGSQTFSEKDVQSPAPSSTSLIDYKLRKFFVLRPGTFDQALADIKAHIKQQDDGALHSTWLLTE